MGGAVVFAGQLLPLLRFPLEFDYIHASRYGNDDARRADRLARRRRRDSVRGRTVLVLDDILDGGETMAAIRERLLELGARGVPLRGAGGEERSARQKPIARRLRRPRDRRTASSSAAAWTPRATGATCPRSAP